jgi:dihydrofolate reductase
VANLIYSAITSLDGYVADDEGKFEWAQPDEELHGFVNDLERSIGTYLYGRRMYETMVFWETAHTLIDEPNVIQDYARIWQEADKVVYSRTLRSGSTQRTRIERDFDPETVRAMKASVDRDMSIGGADLAAQALETGLVDECHLFLHPVVVGSGSAAFSLKGRVDLELLENRLFGSGVVHLHYRVLDR